MNSPMIHIGNDDRHENALDTAKAIATIFEAARKQSMDQHIVSAALEAFSKVAEIKNVTITNSVFTNNPTKDEAGGAAADAPSPAPAGSNEIDDDEEETE